MSATMFQMSNRHQHQQQHHSRVIERSWTLSRVLLPFVALVLSSPFFTILAHGHASPSQRASSLILSKRSFINEQQQQKQQQQIVATTTGAVATSGSLSKRAQQDGPLLLSKTTNITAYEQSTIVLPCDILNLPVDMHVIWQRGGRDETNKTVLTIGRTQIESNYRVRVTSSSSSSSSNQQVENGKVTSNNLEIRRLFTSDSGWYECQIPTKPTQKTYIYLEVLGSPKIEANVTTGLRSGDTVELTCHVDYLPARYKLNWYLDEKNLNEMVAAAEVVNRSMRNSNESSSSSSSSLSSSVAPVLPYRIEAVRKRDCTLTRLTIINFTEVHSRRGRGVYKCKYDAGPTSIGEAVYDPAARLKLTKSSSRLDMFDSFLLSSSLSSSSSSSLSSTQSHSAGKSRLLLLAACLSIVSRSLIFNSYSSINS